jgi:hypothetical protein
MRCAGIGCVLSLVAFLPPVQAQIKFYLKLEVDPGSRLVRLGGEVPIKGSFPTVEYFEQITGEILGQTRSTVLREGPAGERQPSRTEIFYLDSGGLLVSREKYQEIFKVSGAALVAESLYQYPGLQYGVGSIGFGVGVDNGPIRHEVPKTIDKLPLSAQPLNSITVIRISELRGIDVAAVATYNEAGELFSVVVRPLKPNEHVPPPAKPQTVDEVIQEAIRQFGFPVSFSVSQFQLEPTPLYELSESVSPLTVINFHYARNRWVQQYVFHDPATTQSKFDVRFLEFRFTAQDDDLRLFDQSLAWNPATDQRMSFARK